MSQPEPPKDDDTNDDIVDADVVDTTSALALPDAGAFTPLTPDYTDDGTPTFDYVRDKIEGRAAMAMGSAELPEPATNAQALEDRLAAREQAGKDRLEQIRRAMREK